MRGMFLATLFRDPLSWAVSVVIVIASIVLHELGHGLAATWEGDPTPRIRGHLTWNPVVHMGWVALGLLALLGISWGQTPVTPAYFRHRRWGEVLVSAAGPIVNLGLAVLGALIVGFLVERTAASEASFDQAGTAAHFWLRVLLLNVVLFFLNLIPLPPLDGFGVAEGAFDLGNLGATLRRWQPWPLVVAVLIVNSDPFQAVVGAAGGILVGVSRGLFA